MEYLLNILGLAFPYMVSAAHRHAKWHAGAISCQLARHWRATPKIPGAPISRTRGPHFLVRALPRTNCLCSVFVEPISPAPGQVWGCGEANPQKGTGSAD